LRLSGISYRAGSELWLRDIDLSLAEGGINVLLGATLAVKDSARGRTIEPGQDSQ
jgi:hypothetical protein